MRFDFVKLSGCRVGFELRNQIRHCKTVCIKRNLYLINYTVWEHSELQKEIETPVLLAHAIEDSTDIFGISGGGLNTPNPPSVHHCLGLEGRVILKWIFKWDGEGMDWIDLAQDREWCINEPLGS